MNENEFTLTLDEYDLRSLLCGAARLTDGLTQLFIDSSEALTNPKPANGLRDDAADWIIVNYEAVAGSIEMLRSATALLMKVFLDKTVTITD